MNAILHLRLLGGFRLVYGGEPVAGIDSPRLQSLVAYLALHRDLPQPRRQLAYLLWPDSSEAQARTNLRNLLHHLRRALPEADRFLRLEARAVQVERSPGSASAAGGGAVRVIVDGHGVPSWSRRRVAADGGCAAYPLGWGGLPTPHGMPPARGPRVTGPVR